MIFVDTSAFYALADRDDRSHQAAAEIFGRLRIDARQLATTNYVVIETAALLQRRLGQEAATRFLRDVVTLTDCIAIDSALHDAAIELFVSSNSRRLSLVDCSSIAYMRSTGIKSAFAFDPDFERYGIELLQ